MQFGPERLLGTLLGHGPSCNRISIPNDGLLTSLRLGRTTDSISLFTLEVRYSPIVGIGQLHFDGASGTDRTVAQPGSLSKLIELPEGAAWGDWGFFNGGDPGLLVSWPGRVTNPGFVLGPEEEGMGTKCPENGGGGALATKPGWTITGLRFTKDPSDLDVGLRLWYRQLL